MATRDAIGDLVSKMQEERARLLAVIAALNEAEAESAPAAAEGEAQWSAKQQCSHLAEMESNYRAWVEEARLAENPDVSRVRGSAVAIPLERAHEHTVQRHIDSLENERHTTLRMVSAMLPEEFDRKATHQLFGTLSLLQWLRSYYRHDRMHVDQISGREPEYKPRFARSREPDRRR
ncbi:MAG: hypothetical protein GEU28_01240 [Dehalococcoidia bacterium]|nr:hypothetical protein [Dehalococcoidia bacterium]